MPRSFSISVTTRRPLPHVPFEKIARRVLGARYELSLVICGDTLARRMNRAYRMRTYAANVLSFPLSKYEGEIFLNISAAEREARRLKVSLRERLVLLFAHACLHLKGRKHGSMMEQDEIRIVRRFV